MGWLKSIPDWVWLALVIVLVANHIDRRLMRMEDLLFDLHERLVDDDNKSGYYP
jgi:hypothetical protein